MVFSARYNQLYNRYQTMHGQKHTYCCTEQQCLSAAVFHISDEKLSLTTYSCS